MGNSIQACSKNHDLPFNVREAQAAVDAMQTWRQHLLAKQQPVLVTAPAEEGGADVCASDGNVSSHLALTTAFLTYIPSAPTALVHAAAAPPHYSMVVWHHDVVHRPGA